MRDPPDEAINRPADLIRIDKRGGRDREALGSHCVDQYRLCRAGRRRLS